MQLFWQDLVNGFSLRIFAVVRSGSARLGHHEHHQLGARSFVMLGAYLSYVLFSTWHVDPFLSIRSALWCSSCSGIASSASSSTSSCARRFSDVLADVRTFAIDRQFALLVFHGDVKGITTQYSGSNFSIGGVTIAGSSCGR